MSVIASDSFSTVVKKEQKGQVNRELTMPDRLVAPVKQGNVIGKISFSLAGKTVGTVDAITASAVKKAGIFRSYGAILQKWLNVN